MKLSGIRGLPGGVLQVPSADSTSPWLGLFELGTLALGPVLGQRPSQRVPVMELRTPARSYKGTDLSRPALDARQPGQGAQASVSSPKWHCRWSRLSPVTSPRASVSRRLGPGLSRSHPSTS